MPKKPPGNPTMVCRLCLAEKPLDQFRPYRKDGQRRRRECRDCVATYNTALAHAKKEKKLAKMLGQVASSRHSDRYILNRILVEMVALFGGVPQLVKFWHEHALACPPGGKLALCTGPALLRLMLVKEALDKKDFAKRKHPDDMSDAELEEALSEYDLEDDWDRITGV